MPLARALRVERGDVVSFVGGGGKTTAMFRLASELSAAVFLAANQPPAAADIVRTVVQAHRQSFAPACVPVFDGRRGNPVLFDRTLFDRLARLRGDAGEWDLLEEFAAAVVEVPASIGE